MIRLYAITALLAALVGLGWYGQSQNARALTAENALSGATARLEQVEKARAAHEAHIAAMTRQQAAYEALLAEMEQQEGGDAVLSDYLRALDQRLR